MNFLNDLGDDYVGDVDFESGNQTGANGFVVVFVGYSGLQGTVRGRDVGIVGFVVVAAAVAEEDGDDLLGSVLVAEKE